MTNREQFERALITTMYRHKFNEMEGDVTNEAIRFYQAHELGKSTQELADANVFYRDVNALLAMKARTLDVDALAVHIWKLFPQSNTPVSSQIDEIKDIIEKHMEGRA